MAYSRFLNSVWCTYYYSSSDGSRYRLKQKLCIQRLRGEQIITLLLEYGEIKKLDRAIEKIKNEFPEATKDQIEEIKCYINEFIRDVKYNCRLR